MRTRVLYRHFQKNYPAFHERLRGVADVYGCDLQRGDVDASLLLIAPLEFGCSAVFYPPATTADGCGIMSRNFDFTTGTFQGRAVAPGRLPVCARPYVLEVYPDEGYASLMVCCFDLLCEALDGVNSEGLTVAVLADDETMAEHEFDPTLSTQPGFNEVQIARFLLDTCATVAEAKAALLEAKLYYSGLPCHYLVADRHGDCFVWENSPVMHRGHIIDGDGSPMATTNFLLHMHPNLDDLPVEKSPRGSFNRFRTIRQRVADEEDPFDLDFIRATNACVAADNPRPPREPFARFRTLWHALYFPKQRRVVVKFYLGDEPDPDDPDQSVIRWSDDLAFRLQQPSE